MVHKGHHGLKRVLSTFVFHEETLGFLVTCDIAGNADTELLVFGIVIELLPLFGVVSTLTNLIHLNFKNGSVLRIIKLLFFLDLFINGFKEILLSVILLIFFLSVWNIWCHQE